MQHGRVLVAVTATTGTGSTGTGGTVAGFGAVQRIGDGPAAVAMLCDLFMDPVARGTGAGRALLADLWAGSKRRMTFSSLHEHAVPLYTSFGLDAWWPLLYLHGQPGSVPMPAGWRVTPATAAEVSALELGWTGTDRAADHPAWAARPGGRCVMASHDGEVLAAGTIAGPPAGFGIVHLALAPGGGDRQAAAAVLAVAATIGSPGQVAWIALPAPHPAVRPLLASGWRFDEFDLFMASDPGLLDARRAVPSPAQA
jgi:hypothetical protein